MAAVDRVRTLAEPIVEAHDAAIYDVTQPGGKLVVAVTRPDGIDLDTLTAITRELNVVLDEADPIGGNYTLEVTSPGLERPLRTPEHFAGAVGETVTVRTHPDAGAERRVRGVLSAAGDDTFTVVIDEAAGSLAVGDEHTVAYDHVERARTIFQWGPAPKPGGKNKSGQKKSGQSKSGQKKSGQKKSGQQKSGQNKKPSQKKAPST